MTNGNEFQEALTQVAVNGQEETIFIAEGIYQKVSGTGVHYANFEYDSEERYSISIIGEPGTSSSDVIIDANGSGFCLNITSSIIGPYEDFNGEVNVSGIKIQNGNTIEYSSGLHVFATQFRVIINNCEIINNITYSYYGSGAEIFAKNLYMENNKVLYNTCYDF